MNHSEQSESFLPFFKQPQGSGAVLLQNIASVVPNGIKLLQ